MSTVHSLKAVTVVKKNLSHSTCAGTHIEIKISSDSDDGRIKNGGKMASTGGLTQSTAFFNDI